jgi:cation diffusion facilitator family transporter
MNHTDAQKEKRAVALTSVLAAVGLTVFKLIIGILTNSLGIISEAAHSGLDLLAALVTYFSVRISDKPADKTHHYGHGKVENLSALFQTLLLLATSGWIIYEVINRLFFHPEEVEASIWGFVIMTISIIVCVNQSRRLYRVAKKYNSHALEADGLHFKTDIWSSIVVLLGLLGVFLAKTFPALEWLRHTDAIAALVVAIIVLVVSCELGWRTITALLDTAPKGQEENIKKIAESVPGVVEAHAIRIRPSGADCFADLHILVDPDSSTEEAHSLATEVEEKIYAELSTVTNLVVHIEPAKPGFHD